MAPALPRSVLAAQSGAIGVKRLEIPGEQQPSPTSALTALCRGLARVTLLPVSHGEGKSPWTQSNDGPPGYGMRMLWGGSISVSVLVGAVPCRDSQHSYEAIQAHRGSMHQGMPKHPPPTAAPRHGGRYPMDM